MRKAEHLATDEACRSPFWPTPGLKNRNVYMDSDKTGSQFLRPLYPTLDPVFKYTQKGLLFVRCVSYTEWSCYHKFPLYNYWFHLFLLDILYTGTPNTQEFFRRHFFFFWRCSWLNVLLFGSDEHIYDRWMSFLIPHICLFHHVNDQSAETFSTSPFSSVLQVRCIHIHTQQKLRCACLFHASVA